MARLPLWSSEAQGQNQHLFPCYALAQELGKNSTFTQVQSQSKDSGAAAFCFCRDQQDSRTWIDCFLSSWTRPVDKEQSVYHTNHGITTTYPFTSYRFYESLVFKIVPVWAPGSSPFWSPGPLCCLCMLLQLCNRVHTSSSNCYTSPTSLTPNLALPSHLPYPDVQGNRSFREATFRELEFSLSCLTQPC